MVGTETLGVAKVTHTAVTGNTEAVMKLDMEARSMTSLLFT